MTNRALAMAVVALGVACAEQAPPPASAVPPAPPVATQAPPPPPAGPASTVQPAATPSASATPVALTLPETPDNIKPPAPAKLVLKANAKGAQIYVCDKSKDPKLGYEWTLKGPDAVLSDESGKAIGRHYAGPTWESVDGSKVVAAVKSKVDAPDSAAIPWLLLEAKSAEGQGALGKVTWVQRVHTSAGKAPATGCDKAHAGSEARVDYAAEYYFYAP